MSDMRNSLAALSKKQIDDFFKSNAGVTREQCDSWAVGYLGLSVQPTLLQGAESYTVEAGEAVIQFRSGENALDIELIRGAQIAYGPHFVPCPRHVGTFDGILAYLMDNVGGSSIYLCREELRANDCYLLRNTVEDFARFLSAGWYTTQADTDRYRLHNSYRADLERLQVGLPRRFSSTLDGLLQDLSSLFEPGWPVVFNHTDLLENNIHVDSCTGRITGICDWKDTAIGPFGVSLEGLECLLGWRTRAGWRWVNHSAQLRQDFWTTLAAMIPGVSLERVQSARLVGIFLKFGFEWVTGDTRLPLQEDSKDLAFLEAITLDVDVRK